MNSDKNLSAYQSQSAYEDEVSLIDLINVLLRRKKLILGVTVITVCIGLFYAFSQQQVYQVETILLPPSIENVQPLNESSIGNTTISNVFEAFTKNMNSRKLKKTFFEKHNVLETLSSNSTQALTEKDKNDYFEGFLKAIKVNEDMKSSSIKVTLDGVHKEKIGYWLDSLIRLSNQETVNQLIRNLQVIIDSKIKNLNINIASKRFIYKQRREDELGRLHEAYQTAKKLGLRGYNNTGTKLSNASNLSIYMNDAKLYMQGTEVLLAEIEALKNRKSDDIHIPDLRDLQEQLTRLESIKIEKNKLQTVLVDKKGTVNIELIKPKRKLIIILSLILGGMLGIFAGFIMEFVSNFKKHNDNLVIE